MRKLEEKYMNLQREVILTRYDKGQVSEVSDVVVCEYPFTIYINGEETVTLVCSPDSLDYLTLGYLLSEGIINKKTDIESVDINEEKGAAYVKLSEDAGNSPYFKGGRRPTKGCSGGTIFYNIYDFVQSKISDKKIQIHYKKILSLMEEFTTKSDTFRDTGGVHGAALSDGEKILIFNEDIGRHNAMDKVIGEAFAKDMVFEDKIILTSGRISSEMLIKAAKRNVSVMVSRSAPMDLAIRIGEEINLTTVGFVRGERMNVYTGKDRILFGE